MNALLYAWSLCRSLRRAPLSVSIILSLFCQGLFSGVVQAEAPAELDPIHIEGQAETAFPASVSRNAKELKKRHPATSDAASLLSDIPGVYLNGAGGVSSLPSIRGLADDRLRIKVDGMDLIASCPNHMNPPISYVDTSQVGSIEVFAGITPVSLGGDSIGGTIVVDTLDPVFAEAGKGSLADGEVGTFYRSNNQAFGGNLSASYANERFNIRYSGAWNKADNYSAGGNFKTSGSTGVAGHTLPLDEVGSSAYETENHALDMAFKRGDDLLELKLAYQDVAEQLYPNQRMDMLDNTQKRARLRWIGAFEWGELEASGYYEKVEHYMNFGADKRFWYGTMSQPPTAPEPGSACSPVGFLTCAAGMPMFSDGTTSGAAIKSTIDIASTKLLRLGGEYQRYRLDDYWPASGGGMWPDTFININDGERDRLAAYAEFESQLQKDWLALIGLRHEWVDSNAGDVSGYKSTLPATGNQIVDANAFNSSYRKITDNNLDLTALLRYTRNKNLDIEFGLARKVRSPNLYERYTWSSWAMAALMNNFVGDGNGYIGDIDLKPETAYIASATFDWHAADDSWSFKATPYYTKLDDYIDAVRLPVWQPDQFNVLQFANQSARIYGIDLSGEITLANNSWGDWALEGLASYTNGENRDSGDNLYNIMPLNGKLILSQERGGWSNALELLVVDDKDDVSGVRNEIETDAYTLIHLRGSYSWDKVRVDFGVENLFDKLYFLPTGGAYLGQGATMRSTGAPWGIAVPGMGQSFYVGLNLKF